MSELKEHLDGPGFAAWVDEQIGDTEDGITMILGDSLYRRHREWRNGAIASLGAADKVCVRLGLHVDVDVPEHLWCDPPQKGKPLVLSWERVRALEMLSEGYFPAEVGKLLGVSKDQVRSWRDFERRNPGATARARVAA